MIPIYSTIYDICIIYMYLGDENPTVPSAVAAAIVGVICVIIICVILIIAYKGKQIISCEHVYLICLPVYSA